MDGAATALVVGASASFSQALIHQLNKLTVPVRLCFVAAVPVGNDGVVDEPRLAAAVVGQWGTRAV